MDILADTYKQVKHILDERHPCDVFGYWKNHPTTVTNAVGVGVGYSIGTGELRKGSNLPVWTHLHKSAVLGKLFGLGPGELAALWLHDCVEDSGWCIDSIVTHFTPYVAKLVEGLTQLNSDEPRKVRISSYHDQLADCCAMTQTCKFIESITNIYVIVDDAPKFARVFLSENLDMYNKLTKAHPLVRDIFYMFLQEAFEKLETK